MKKLALILISLFIITQNVFADEQSILKQHFLSKIGEVVKIVKNEASNKELRNSKIVETLTPMFDFELMAKLSLGKKWKQLDSENKKEFVELYVARMKHSYSSKIDAYSNQNVEVSEISQTKKNRMILVTNLMSADKKFEISYKFYKPKKLKPNKDEWLIYDIVILGASIIKVDKAQFREFLQTKTIEELMVELQLK